MPRFTMKLLGILAGVAMTMSVAAADGMLYPDGSIRFSAISRTIPEITVQQGDVCDIVLEDGERINQAIISDSIRWKMTDGISGNATPHIFVKPVSSNLHALLTITTTRRTYHIRLTSTDGAGREFVGFYYPTPMNEIRQNLMAREHAVSVPRINAAWTSSAPMDSRYAFSGARQFRPKSVCNDGAHTYLNMDHIDGTLPVLVTVGDGNQDQIIGNPTWQPLHNEYTIDGVPNHLALVRDSRHGQIRVNITRTGR